MIGQTGWCEWCGSLRQIAASTLIGRMLCKRCVKSGDWRGVEMKDFKSIRWHCPSEFRQHRLFTMGSYYE